MALGEQEIRRGIDARTLAWHEAAAVKDHAVGLLKELGVTGVIAITNSLGMELSRQVIGDDVTQLRPASVDAKTRTVLVSHRSTTIQNQRMVDSGQTREDFNGTLGNLRGGGVAIFADEELKVFLGATAISAGSEEIAEEVGDKAVRMAGFYTDIPQTK